MEARRYRITVRGRLSDRFAASFDGLAVERGDGVTTLTGPVRDQAQLYGVLEHVADYGLELVGVAEDVGEGGAEDVGEDVGEEGGVPRRPDRGGVRRWCGRGATFLAAWFVLDRMATAPPRPLATLAALAAAAAVLVVGGTLLAGDPLRGTAIRLGLGRPAGRAVLTAVLVGCAVPATFAVGAALLDVRLALRADWPVVLVGVLLFHGLAEELVWRGYVFGHLRRATTFRRAVAASVPLIALTHVPLIAGNGWFVGSLAVLTAAATCVPLAYLWERGGGTTWAPAVLHGLIGTWQLLDRSYPPSFQVVPLVASILVPYLVFVVHPVVHPVVHSDVRSVVRPVVTEDRS